MACIYFIRLNEKMWTDDEVGDNILIASLASILTLAIVCCTEAVLSPLQFLHIIALIAFFLKLALYI
jgi:hypothetical protein